jgi:outer membrane protein assembly factor BamB
MAASAVLLLAGCATPSFWPFGGDQADDPRAAQEREGRIPLVGADEVLVADPAFASAVISLPVAEPVASWSELGGSSLKAAPHVPGETAPQVLWKRKVGEATDRRSRALSTPVGADGVLYLLDADQRVVAVSASSGAVVWRVTLQSDNRRDRTAVGGGVAISGGTVYATSGLGFVVALDAATGAEKWRRDVGQPVSGAPNIQGQRLFAVTNSNEVFAINTTTGAIEWNDQAIAEPARLMAAQAPASAEDIVVVPFSSGELVAYFPSNGRRLWTDTLSRASRSTPMSAINDIARHPVISQGAVYAASHSGLLAAISVRSGQRAWAVRFPSTHAPAVIGAYVIAMSSEGQLAAFDRFTGSAIWVRQFDAFEDMRQRRRPVVWTSPVVRNNEIVLFNSQGEMVTAAVQTGEVLSTRRIGAAIELPPIVLGSTIYVYTEAGELIAIG